MDCHESEWCRVTKDCCSARAWWIGVRVTGWSTCVCVSFCVTVGGWCADVTASPVWVVWWCACQSCVSGVIVWLPVLCEWCDGVTAGPVWVVWWGDCQSCVSGVTGSPVVWWCDFQSCVSGVTVWSPALWVMWWCDCQSCVMVWLPVLCEYCDGVTASPVWVVWWCDCQSCVSGVMVWLPVLCVWCDGVTASLCEWCGGVTASPVWVVWWCDLGLAMCMWPLPYGTVLWRCDLGQVTCMDVCDVSVKSVVGCVCERERVCVCACECVCMCVCVCVCVWCWYEACWGSVNVTLCLLTQSCMCCLRSLLSDCMVSSPTFIPRRFVRSELAAVFSIRPGGSTVSVVLVVSLFFSALFS